MSDPVDDPTEPPDEEPSPAVGRLADSIRQLVRREIAPLEARIAKLEQQLGDTSDDV